MIIDDTIAEVILLAMASGIGWIIRKVNKLSIDVAVIKTKLHMR